MMALSAAYDRDLSFERNDLERFSGLYRNPPEGLFLKRGKQLRIRLRGSPPFVNLVKLADKRNDRLYFGKAFIYPVAVAPFVRAAGMNGFLVFHVLLLFGVCVCGYRFLSARSQPGPALLFTLAFVAATVVPVDAVFLPPEIFNFALVFFAYFLWLYKEVAPARGTAFLRSGSSDAWAAILLGMATYSKPTNGLLIAPLVLLLFWRRRFWRGAVVGAVCVLTTAGLFGINGLNSGEFNYQGGDRKTFYADAATGPVPLRRGRRPWEQRGIPMTTNDSDVENVLEPSELVIASGSTSSIPHRPHFHSCRISFRVCRGLLVAFLRDRFEPWRLLRCSGSLAQPVALRYCSLHVEAAGDLPAIAIS
jgi:hypothetical protein